MAAAALALALTAGCSSGGPGSKFCDAAAELQASVDPLVDPAVRADPTRLQAALQQRVLAYAALARVAPKDLQGSAVAARDGMTRIANALAAVGNDVKKADASPEIAAAVGDPAFTSAVQDLRRHALKDCGLSS